MRTQLTTLSIAASLFIPVVGRGQSTVPIPARQHEILVMAGQTLRIDTGRLVAGRPYAFAINVVSETDPSGDGWVEVTTESTRGLEHHPLRAGDRGIELTSIPLNASARIKLTGGGELGTVYRVRTTWRAMPMSRMPGVTFTHAPHQNDRPPGATVTAVIVHATVSPTLDSTVRWFLAPESQVSAHYTVGKDGAIVQMVEDTERAWHAGVSELEGVRGVNDFSVGIEIVNLNDGRDPYTDAQYEAVAAIIRHLREQFHLPDSRIVSHEFIARPRGRKSDPRGFDFPRLFRMLAER